MRLAAGNPSDGIPFMESSIRSDPRSPFVYLRYSDLATAHLVVKKGWKAWASTAEDMPTPVSWTDTRASPASPTALRMVRGGAGPSTTAWLPCRCEPS